MMPYGQWTVPSAPSIPNVSLPAVSPRRPASAIPTRPPSSQAWPGDMLGFAHQNRTRPDQKAPSHWFPSNSEARPIARSYSNSSSHITVTYDPSIYDNAGRIPAVSYESYTSRPPALERTRSMTPAPLVSILKTSRARTNSLSSKPRRSNLSKSQTTTVHRTAPLKEEAISLSWPLVQYTAGKRSRKPILYFDIGFDPRESKNLMDKQTAKFFPLQDADRILPASTHCALKKMIIDCPHIGQITVRRSEGLRCIDVFAAIYDAYHRRLRREEEPQDIHRYTLAFEQRCEDSPHSASELKAGMRRVDLLRGKRIFDGLTRSGADWKLHIHANSGH
ncbi:hypothetical protein DFH09DRAFT_1210806 [Mycena vulgaris]|nr:hypothetical protein DFH09DRAFT_1210806 [Mycena vulgaris]